MKHEKYPGRQLPKLSGVRDSSNAYSLQTILKLFHCCLHSQTRVLKCLNEVRGAKMKHLSKSAFEVFLTLMIVAGAAPASAGESFAPVPGFLVPTEEAIPSDYRAFIRIIKKDLYAFQYDRWVALDRNNLKPVIVGNGVVGIQGVAENGQLRDAQLLFSEQLETANFNYDTMKKFFEGDRLSKKVKEFTVNGSNGVIFVTSSAPETGRVTYELLFKDENRLLKITNVFEKKDPEFSSDSLIDMLQKFKRVK